MSAVDASPFYTILCEAIGREPPPEINPADDFCRRLVSAFTGLMMTGQGMIGVDKPRDEAAKIEEIRRDIRRLERRLSSFSPSVQWLLRMQESPELATLSALRTLEGALEKIEHAMRDEASTRPNMGQPPNWRARFVALVLANFIYNETGQRPGLRKDPIRSTPYGRALEDLFDLMGVDAAPWSSGEWARKNVHLVP